MAVNSAYYTTGIGSAYGKIVTGVVTVTTAGTAVRITSTSTPIAGVWVAADAQATASFFAVGDSNVNATLGSQQGIIVIPAQASIFIPVNDLSLLWVDADQNSGDLAYAYLQPADNL